MTPSTFKKGMITLSCWCWRCSDGSARAALINPRITWDELLSTGWTRPEKNDSRHCSRCIQFQNFILVQFSLHHNESVLRQSVLTAILRGIGPTHSVAEPNSSSCLLQCSASNFPIELMTESVSATDHFSRNDKYSVAEPNQWHLIATWDSNAVRFEAIGFSNHHRSWLQNPTHTHCCSKIQFNSR